MSPSCQLSLRARILARGGQLHGWLRRPHKPKDFVVKLLWHFGKDVVGKLLWHFASDDLYAAGMGTS